MSSRSLLPLFLAGAAFLGAAEPVRPLSLEDSVRIAWSQDRSVLPLSLERELASAREVQAGVRPPVELDLQAEAPLGGAGEWGLGVGVRRSLPRRERVELARALARVEGEAAPWLVREQRRRVAGETRARYYDWVVRWAQRAAARRSVAELDELLARLDRLRATGKMADVDWELVRLERDRAGQAEALADAALRAAEERLRARLRVAPDLPLEPAAKLDDLIDRSPPLAAGVDERARPELALAAHAVARAEAAVGLARAEGRPEWTLGAGLGFERRSNDASGRLESEPSLQWGASVPVGREPRNRGDILERQAAVRLAEARREATRADVAAEAAGAVAAVRALHPAVVRLRGSARAPAVPPALEAAVARGEVATAQLVPFRQLHLAREQEFLSAAAHYVSLLAEAETALGLVPQEP